MRLYFFRHGDAEAPAEGMNDAERRLTPKGKRRTRAAAEALAARKVRPARLMSSPLARARETADLLAKRLDQKVEVVEALGPGFSLDALRSLLADAGDDADFLFVGHEPDFSTVIGDLIGGGAVVMKKGGLARIDIVARDPLHGALVWLLSPRILQDLS